MREACAGPECPRWAIHFAVHEKLRQNDGELEGNNRFELDIVLERTQRGPRPKFVIEAKRLGPRHPVANYLGPEGLGAFIACEYANEHDDVGMLGYVQTKTLVRWREALGQELETPRGKHRVEVDGTWTSHVFRGGPAFTYCSRHTRSGNRGAITVYHTLLDFTRQGGRMASGRH